MSKVSGKTANDIRMKGFLKNKEEKKYKYDGILNKFFLIFYNLKIFKKNKLTYFKKCFIIFQFMFNIIK